MEGGGAPRTWGWAVNDGNADQAEEIEMGPAGPSWETRWPGREQVKRSPSVSRPRDRSVAAASTGRSPRTNGKVLARGSYRDTLARNTAEHSGTFGSA